MRPYSDKWQTAVLAWAGVDFSKNEKQGEIVAWWVSTLARVTMVLGGERAGKSLIAALLMALSMSPEEAGEYWIVGPDYRQARPEFLYLYTWFKDAGLIAGDPSMPVNEAAAWSFTTIWGATVRTRSSADVQKLASFSVKGIIMAEAAQQLHEAYLKLLGRISETGGFLILSGTLERGLPWYGDLYNRWQGSNTLDAKSWSLPTWSNLEVYPGGRDDPRIKELESEYPAELFMERFGAVPQKRTGLVLPEFDMARHVRRLKLDPGSPVYLAIDPGNHTYAVLFCQYLGNTCHVLDRIYEHNVTAYDIIPEAKRHPLFKYIDPHDAGAIDNAGKQHQANKSQVELWREMGGVDLGSQYIFLEDTINVLKFRLDSTNASAAPLIYFSDHMTDHYDNSGLALDVLAEPILWKWPDRHNNKNVPKNPVDRNNDAMKALGYGLVRKYGVLETGRKAPAVVQRSYWF